MTSRRSFSWAVVFLLSLFVLAACGGGEESTSGDDPCGGKCLSNQVCDQGQCVACTSDAHCTSAAAPICRLADNVCVECVQDTQCGLGEVCDNSQCVASGGVSGDECATDDECAGDEVCVSGSCQVCRIGTCNASGDSRCQSATIGGETSWELCDSGVCEDGACQDVQECEPGTCHSESARCTNAGKIEACGSDTVCENNVCKDPTSEFDCTPNQCASSDARCSAAGEILECESNETCTNNTCVATAFCGNNQIDSGEECDGSALNNKTCTTVSDSFDGGTLSCSANCTFDTSACTEHPVPPVEIGSGIEEARAAAKAAQATATEASIAIDNVVVTYVRPAIGQDDAGFFIQASTTGPAIFVNASAGSESPAVGDTISFTATQVVFDEVARISAYENYVKKSSGQSIDHTNYLQEIERATDITDIDTYESEIITGAVTLTGAFGNSNTGFKRASIQTIGYTPATPSRDFVLRVPDAIAAEIEAEAASLNKKVIGCYVNFDRAIYWGYTSGSYHDTQLSIYDASDEYLVDCEDAEEIPSTFDYTETFDSVTIKNSNYTQENSWTNNGISWTALARAQMTEGDTDYSIDGQGVILRTRSGNASSVTATGLTKGVKNITFDYKMWVNDSNTATIEFFNASGTSLGKVETGTVNNSTVAVFSQTVNYTDAASFKITVATTGRMIIDNIRWTNAK